MKIKKSDFLAAALVADTVISPKRKLHPNIWVSATEKGIYMDACSDTISCRVLCPADNEGESWSFVFSSETVKKLAKSLKGDFIYVSPANGKTMARQITADNEEVERVVEINGLEVVDKNSQVFLEPADGGAWDFEVSRYPNTDFKVSSETLAYAIKMAVPMVDEEQTVTGNVFIDISPDGMVVWASDRISARMIFVSGGFPDSITIAVDPKMAQAMANLFSARKESGVASISQVGIISYSDRLTAAIRSVAVRVPDYRVLMRNEEVYSATVEVEDLLNLVTKLIISLKKVTSPVLKLVFSGDSISVCSAYEHFGNGGIVGSVPVESDHPCPNKIEVLFVAEKLEEVLKLSCAASDVATISLVCSSNHTNKMYVLRVNQNLEGEITSTSLLMPTAL
jgi:hypothetical protein